LRAIAKNLTDTEIFLNPQLLAEKSKLSGQLAKRTIQVYNFERSEMTVRHQALEKPTSAGEETAKVNLDTDDARRSGRLVKQVQTLT
jgi:hypothetical protein